MRRHARMRDHRICLHVVVHNRGSGRDGKLWQDYEEHWIVCPENLVWDAHPYCNRVGS